MTRSHLMFQLFGPGYVCTAGCCSRCDSQQQPEKLLHVLRLHHKKMLHFNTLHIFIFYTWATDAVFHWLTDLLYFVCLRWEFASFAEYLYDVWFPKCILEPEFPRGNNKVLISLSARQQTFTTAVDSFIVQNKWLNFKLNIFLPCSPTCFRSTRAFVNWWQRPATVKKQSEKASV